MILAAHQPNFIPWLVLLDKIHKADVFVLLIHCQYEKNGWQNRCQVNGKYLTKPVLNGNVPINEKRYVDGESLIATNIAWIIAMTRTLGIDTSKIKIDYKTDLKGTERIIDLCKHFKCDGYLTNPDSMNKYLDKDLMQSRGITLYEHHFPYKVHTFEAFDRWGIDGTTKLLNKEKKRWKVSHSFSDS